MRPRTPEQLWAFSRRLHRSGYRRLARAVKVFNWLLHKCLLPAEAIVGENIVLEHYALGIVIHPQVTIGNNCRIFHHVTLASESPIGSEYRITIGDGVTIGAHSIVVARGNSNLDVGDGCVLGAGSVLINSMPPHQKWAGNPARELSSRI